MSPNGFKRILWKLRHASLILIGREAKQMMMFAFITEIDERSTVELHERCGC